jgi:hypothetical protein
MNAGNLKIPLTAGAKDMYVVVEGSTGNISAPLRFAAPDTTPPVLSSGTVNRINETSATIGFTTDEAGTAHYLVMNSGSAVPMSATVRSGASLGSVVAGAVTNKAVALTTGAKDIYVVVMDVAGNISAPLRINTPNAVLPVITAGTMVRTSNTYISFGLTIDKAGRPYHIVQEVGMAAPTKERIRTSGVAHSGSMVVGHNGNRGDSVTAGAKDYYYIIEDSAGNLSAPFKLYLAAYEPAVLSSGSVNRTSDTAATITFISSKAGTAYHRIAEGGAAAVQNVTVKSSGTLLGNVSAGIAFSKPIALTAGAKDIYIMVEAAGCLSQVLVIKAAAYVLAKTLDTRVAADLTTVDTKTALANMNVADLKRKVL